MNLQFLTVLSLRLEPVFLVQTYLLWAHSKDCIHKHKVITRCVTLSGFRHFLLCIYVLVHVSCCFCRRLWFKVVFVYVCMLCCTQVRTDGDSVSWPAAVAQRRHRGHDPRGDRVRKERRVRVQQHQLIWGRRLGLSRSQQKHTERPAETERLNKDTEHLCTIKWIFV